MQVQSGQPAADFSLDQPVHAPDLLRIRVADRIGKSDLVAARLDAGDREPLSFLPAIDGKAVAEWRRGQVVEPSLK